MRGAAPGTRETALLAPGMSVQQADAIVFTGGSAFGSGGSRRCCHRARSRRARIPHQCRVGCPSCPPRPSSTWMPDGDGRRPTVESGRAAYAEASCEPVTTGRVGAGTGAVVARWRDQRLPGGLGSAAVEVGGATVGALAVVNAMGDIFTLAGEPLTGGSPAPTILQADLGSGEHTTLVVVATDAALDRAELTRVAVRSHGALAACIRPAHTAFDGDTCFCRLVRRADGRASRRRRGRLRRAPPPRSNQRSPTESGVDFTTVAVAKSLQIRRVRRVR